MKLLMKPVEMILSCACNGSLKPIRFRLTAEDGVANVYTVDHIFTAIEEKIAGNLMIVYSVQSCIEGEIRRFELKYEVKTRIWYVSHM